MMHVLKKAIYAACMNVDSKENHWAYCPDGGNIWCTFQRDKANKTYVHVPSSDLGKEVIKHVKRIFKDLSKHGKTLNQNKFLMV